MIGRLSELKHVTLQFTKNSLLSNAQKHFKGVLVSSSATYALVFLSVVFKPVRNAVLICVSACRLAIARSICSYDFVVRKASSEHFIHRT